VGFQGAYQLAGILEWLSRLAKVQQEQYSNAGLDTASSIAVARCVYGSPKCGFNNPALRIEDTPDLVEVLV